MNIRTVLALAAGTAALAGVLACSGTGTPSDPADHTTAATSTPTATHTPGTPPTTAIASPTTGGGASVKKPKTISIEEANAIGTAKDYLNTESFSRKALIDQLKYEKYSTSAATAAVDSLHVDWNEQAAMAAKEYLADQHFSRGGLVDQLEYDGFTSTQAAYGVKAAGL